MAISAPMQPSTWNQRSSSRRQARESLQIVDCAGVDRPGRSDHAGRLKSRRAILRDRRMQGGEVDPQLGVGRDAPQRPVSQPERLHRLAVAAVNLVGGIEAQGLFDGGDAVFAHVDAGLEHCAPRSGR